MKSLFELWNELSDSEKTRFVKTMEKDIEDIKFWATHKIIGDEEAGTSFIIPIITFDFMKEAATTGSPMEES